jgi:2-polyprenyl-6-methoxyphenol hydroxylase-like FAD-dependent oxidoreductase
MAQGWRQLDVGVIGGGIGGMSVAIALRRAGHNVTIYEKHDFAGEVGASVSCAANGTKWLHEWGVDVAKGDPVVLKSLINRDWKTGKPVSTFNLDDYEEKWGYVYNMFHRQYMHAMLKDCALQEEGEGPPAKMLVNHAVSANFNISQMETDNHLVPRYRPRGRHCHFQERRTRKARPACRRRWYWLSSSWHSWYSSSKTPRRLQLPARQRQHRPGGQAWPSRLLTKRCT